MIFLIIIALKKDITLVKLKFRLHILKDIVFSLNSTNSISRSKERKFGPSLFKECGIWPPRLLFIHIILFLKYNLEKLVK